MADVDPIANLTVTLQRARRGERMHRRHGGLVASWGDTRREIPLAFGSNRLVGGRKPPADIVIDDASVSSQHFELELIDGELLLRDLGSRNGTYVNGWRVEAMALPLGVPFVVGRVPIVIDALAEVARPLSGETSFGELFGESVPMRELFALLERVAPGAFDVLILGETGTGKELVARAIHQASDRARGPFVVLDCASLPAELAEAEIHGHVKGAFTGAHEGRAGLFEAAHGGTIFIDEIGELPLDQQPKLLRVLERREVQRVGENRSRPIDVRVVSATHRDLRQRVEQGTFREDLYFRVASFAFELPPLRSRPGDVEILAQRFLAAFAMPTGARELTPAALERLRAHLWPGNVRELKNVMKVAAQLGTRSGSPLLDVGDLHLLPTRAAVLRAEDRAGGLGPSAKPPEHPSGRIAVPLPFEEHKNKTTHEYFFDLMTFTGGNVSEAARLAGLDRRHLQRWLARLGVRGGKKA